MVHRGAWCECSGIMARAGHDMAAVMSMWWLVVNVIGMPKISCTDTPRRVASVQWCMAVLA